MPMICRVDKLKNVDGSVVALDFERTKEELEHESDLSLAEGVLSFHGRMENKDRVITISGEVCCVLEASCDRCGDAVTIPIRCDLLESFTNLEEKADEEAQEEEDVIHFFEGDEIDLLPYAEQAIFLAMPMKTLCRPDCKGLCPQCGINLNENECSCDKSPIDPRFAVLADLLNKG